jgi:hypothetical protein
VLIGSLPAWRGVPLAAAAGLQAAQSAAYTAAMLAEATALAAKGAPESAGSPRRRRGDHQGWTAGVDELDDLRRGYRGTDIHLCSTFPLTPSHGPASSSPARQQ